MPDRLGDIGWLTFGYSRQAGDEDGRAKQKPKPGVGRDEDGHAGPRLNGGDQRNMSLLMQEEKIAVE